MFVGNKRSHVLSCTSFLSMCVVLLPKIKKLILCNFLTDCTSMQTNSNPKFQIHSILENLQQKCFNFLMLGVNKKSQIFSLSDIKKLRNFYVLTKCFLLYSYVLFSKRLQIYNLEKNMKWMQLKYVISKTFKKKILIVALQNYAKISFKRLYKNLSYLFFHEFFRNIF